MAEIIIILALLVLFWNMLIRIRNIADKSLRKAENLWDTQLDIWSAEKQDDLKKRKADLEAKINKEL